jgi:hypothetical protein
MDHLSDIIRSLSNAHVRFIITGGVAMVLRGAERMTMDLDISVDRDQENLDRFLKLMNTLGMRPRAPIAPETLLDEDILKSFVEEKSALVFTFIHPDEPYRNENAGKPTSRYRYMGFKRTQKTKRKEILKFVKPEDFDGHTEFQRMSPEQRLRWLSEGAKFFYDFRRSLPR